MPPPRDDPSQAHRDAALAVLIHTVAGQLSRVGESLERQAKAIEALAIAVSESSRVANPWVVLGGFLALAQRIVDRLPAWGLVGLLAIPAIGATMALAPAAGPILAAAITALQHAPATP